MEKATIIGIDLAKRVFQVHAAAQDGRPVLGKKVSRAQLLGFLAKQPPEVCSSLNHFTTKLILSATRARACLIRRNGWGR